MFCSTKYLLSVFTDMANNHANLLRGCEQSTLEIRTNLIVFLHGSRKVGVVEHGRLHVVNFEAALQDTQTLVTKCE